MRLKTHIRSGILWTLVFVWAVVIFLFSAQDAKASTALSDRVTEILLNILGIDSPVFSPFPDGFDWLPSVRTLAHFAIFAIFGSLSALAIRSHRLGGPKDWLFPAAISLFYAIFDEIHQAFVPGRSTELKDVMVDFSGAMLGIASIALIYIWIRRRNEKRTAGK